MKLLNLASNNSFWRGIDYHHDKRVMSWEKISGDQFKGEVRGSNNSVYHVEIDLKHPKKSTCNCPFADGRRVICKHMVALNLGIFPGKEQQMMEYIDEQNALYEQEREQELDMRKAEIEAYVMGLSKAELRVQLIQRMVEELYEEKSYW